MQNVNETFVNCLTFWNLTFVFIKIVYVVFNLNVLFYVIKDISYVIKSMFKSIRFISWCYILTLKCRIFGDLFRMLVEPFNHEYCDFNDHEENIG